jgi:hypothetical protein
MNVRIAPKSFDGGSYSGAHMVLRLSIDLGGFVLWPTRTPPDHAQRIGAGYAPFGEMASPANCGRHPRQH